MIGDGEAIGAGGPRDRTAEDSGPRAAGPRLSVIVPVYRAADVLPLSLGALVDSDLSRDDWELIVVNDGADPETAEVASRYADVVIELPGKPRGPSYARNRGSEVARGSVLVFLDADVCAHTDTLRRFRDVFDAQSAVSAVFGSYDDRPQVTGVVSRYRNLLHHYVHQVDAGEAETFWAGCGAIRTEAFHKVGRYDEWHFTRPQIEDIELGRRLRLSGHRIVLDPAIQASHLKEWTLLSVLSTDLRHRGVPWTRLILHEGMGPGNRKLNLRPLHRWCVILAFLSIPMLSVAVILRAWWPAAVALLCVVVMSWLNRRFFYMLRRVAGWRVLAASIPLHFLFYLMSGLSAIYGWGAYSLVGAPLPPADVAAFEEVGAETWPPVPAKPKESVWYKHEGRS